MLGENGIEGIVLKPFPGEVGAQINRQEGLFYEQRCAVSQPQPDDFYQPLGCEALERGGTFVAVYQPVAEYF